MKSSNDKVENKVEQADVVQTNVELTDVAKFEAARAKVLQPLRDTRASLRKQLSKIEKQMIKIDPESVKDASMPTRIDYASRAVLDEHEDGLTLEGLTTALKGHKAISKLEASLQKDAKVEQHDGKWFLKAA